MKTKFALAIFIIFICSANSFAWEYLTNKTVLKVATGWGGEGIYVTTSDYAALANRCGDGRFLIKPDHPLLKVMVTELLVALTYGNKVEIFYDGCQGTLMNLRSVCINKK